MYEKLAQGAADPSKAGRAWSAEARCLLRGGRGEAAAELVMNRFMSRSMEHATDLDGRLIAANELLLALRVWKPDNPRYLTAARRLRELVLDYGNPELPSPQRLFLMDAMRFLPIPNELSTFPTIEGEEIALQLLEADPRPRSGSRFEYGSDASPCHPPGGTGSPSITPGTKDPSLEDWLKMWFRPKNAASESGSDFSIRDGVWKLGSPNHRVIGLFCASTVYGWSEQFLEGAKLAGSPHLNGWDDPPAADSTGDDAGTRWRLKVNPDSGEILNLEAQQTLVYVYLAILTLMLVGWVAYLAAHLYAEDRALASFKDDVATMSWHELKTPVSSIQFLTEALLDDPAPAPGKVREFLNLIAKDTSRLNFMLVNFLTLLRLDKGKYPLVFSPIPASEIITEALDAAGGRFRDKGCELILDIAPELPAVMADKEALIHVFVNLLDNAYKYTPEQKRIRVRVYAQGGTVFFEVQDNGVGIAWDKRKKIFDEFQQGEGNRRLSRRHGGFGVGLSIVQSLVKAHGGGVEVYSEPGQGSTFRVTLHQAKEGLVQ
jgi:signal transduction histidine kinase